MVTIQKKWETVYFTASNKEDEVQVELTIDHACKTYSLCTGNQEMVSFENDTIIEGQLKVRALNAAIKYVRENLK